MERRPEEGARLIARAHLGKLRSAFRRLSDEKDAEALHDVRVGLRKLIGTLAAYRKLLPEKITCETRRRVGKFLDATCSARDAEVALALLPTLHGGTAAVSWLSARWTRQQGAEQRWARRHIERKLPAVLRALRRALKNYRARVVDGPAPSFAVTFRDALLKESRVLAASIERLQATGRQAASHHVRLSAKRLRYLLEPLVGRSPVACQMTEQLTQIQDMLGAERDGALLAERLRQDSLRAPAALRAGIHQLGDVASPEQRDPTS